MKCLGAFYCHQCVLCISLNFFFSCRTTFCCCIYFSHSLIVLSFPFFIFRANRYLHFAFGRIVKVSHKWAGMKANAVIAKRDESAKWMTNKTCNTRKLHDGCEQHHSAQTAVLCPPQAHAHDLSLYSLCVSVCLCLCGCLEYRFIVNINIFRRLLRFIITDDGIGLHTE